MMKKSVLLGIFLLILFIQNVSADCWKLEPVSPVFGGYVDGTCKNFKECSFSETIKCPYGWSRKTIIEGTCDSLCNPCGNYKQTINYSYGFDRTDNDGVMRHYYNENNPAYDSESFGYAVCGSTSGGGTGAAEDVQEGQECTQEQIANKNGEGTHRNSDGCTYQCSKIGSETTEHWHKVLCPDTNSPTPAPTSDPYSNPPECNAGRLNYVHYNIHSDKHSTCCYKDNKYTYIEGEVCNFNNCKQGEPPIYFDNAGREYPLCSRCGCPEGASCLTKNIPPEKTGAYYNYNSFNIEPPALKPFYNEKCFKNQFPTSCKDKCDAYNERTSQCEPNSYTNGLDCSSAVHIKVCGDGNCKKLKDFYNWMCDKSKTIDMGLDRLMAGKPLTEAQQAAFVTVFPAVPLEDVQKNMPSACSIGKRGASGGSGWTSTSWAFLPVILVLALFFYKNGKK